MYRCDIRDNELELQWNGSVLEWIEEDNFLSDEHGTPYRKAFSFVVEGIPVEGWVGILSHGSRRKAGFAMLRNRRVIYGHPGTSWRPSSIYGPDGGFNNLVNQRIVGEVHLEAPFETTQTKDKFIFDGNQEEELLAALKEVAADYMLVANQFRRSAVSIDLNPLN